MGTFGAAFAASLITVVREGLEVILVLAMLIAFVSKAFTPATAQPRAESGNGRGSGLHQLDGATSEQNSMVQAKERALRAIWWGTGLAAIASIATAVALSALVASVQGGAREILEGVVMLLAACVLFYVSHWLISHVEAKRWMDFLKQQARHGLEIGGQGALALTAFLAVYREGAETALLYQALLGSEGKTQAGLFGVFFGLMAGLGVLTVIAVLIRATTVRLPVRTFFKVSGLFLFALSVVFAGNGVFELQNAGMLVTTNLSWLGRGLPSVGLYPNVQVVSVQLLLLAGAVLAWLVIPRKPPASEHKPRLPTLARGALTTIRQRPKRARSVPIQSTARLRHLRTQRARPSDILLCGGEDQGGVPAEPIPGPAEMLIADLAPPISVVAKEEAPC